MRTNSQNKLSRDKESETVFKKFVLTVDVNTRGSFGFE